jgi:hypothetical protein
MKVDRLAFALLAAGIAGLVHCGGSVSSSGTGTSSSSSSGGGSSSSSTSSSSASSSSASSSGTESSSSASSGTGGSAGCPPAEPSAGAPCTGSIACTYGEEVIPACRPRWKCKAGAWIEAPVASCPMDMCPATEPAGGSPCGKEYDTCGYAVDGAICKCLTCFPFGGCDAGPPTWQCFAPTKKGCPTICPNQGTACADEGLECDCEACGTAAICKMGIWQWEPLSC